MKNKNEFGDHFQWGVSTAAYQIEGAHDIHGKGSSIWDTFVNRKGKITGGHHGKDACQFYHNYTNDIQLLKYLNIENFRFSFSWSRILPQGTGQVNMKGLDFYDRLLDECLENNIEPWATLYHWDLPQALEDKGGWTNRDIEQWFMQYAEICSSKFGDRIRHWMVLNEPMVFTGAGYFLGVHAPGRIGLKNFLSSAHHAALCQAQGARVIRSNVPEAQIGSTFSCSYLQPMTSSRNDELATRRFDALLNRLFIEPSLGLGYPVSDLKFLRRIYDYHKPGDESLLPFDFDFIGIQNYTREIVSHSYFIPYLQAKLIKANKRNVPATVMNWEVYPESLYQMLTKFGNYSGIKKLIVTENGAAFPDSIVEGNIYDHARTNYLKSHIAEVLRAKQEGIPVEGYFVWTLLDNFEWAEGYFPRFGLVYVNFHTQERIIKQSGNWYKSFLENQGQL
jgi:beta-glucosidase